MKIKHIRLIFLMSFFCTALYAQQEKSVSNNEPLRLGIVGLSHAHLWEVISRLDRGDFEVVGIAEKNTASWNWPISRKDMHIYGDKSYIYQDDKTSMRICRDDKETRLNIPEMTAPYNDAFLYLKAVVNGDISVKPDDLSAPENNLTVVEILEAAIESSKTGKVIKLQ